MLSANSFWNIGHFRKPMLTGFADAGYRVVAIAAPDRHMEDLRSRGIECWTVPIARSGTNPAADVALVWRYLRLLRSIRPAAYLGFTIKPNIYGGIAARLAAVPAVSSVTGLGTSYIGSGAMWTLVRRLYALAFRSAHTVFFHNRADLEFMLEQGVVREGQGRVVAGSGLDLDHFRPAGASAEEPEAPVFLFIGRLIVHKGIREFVEAARVMRPQWPHARFQLLGNVDPGNPSSVSAAELDAWVAEGIIEHLGEQVDVRPAIAASTAVVLPSYREGLSRALLEGAAMGKPLVGADVPGIRELITEGVTGALCRAQDPVSLAEAMARIANAPAAARAELGRNARAMVERAYSEQAVVDTYLEVLGRIRARLPA